MQEAEKKTPARSDTARETSTQAKEQPTNRADRSPQESQTQQPSAQERAQQQSANTQDQVIPEGAEGYFPEFIRPLPEELVLEWQAPSRPFKKHKRQYFTTVATIALLLCLILFFAGQFLPIAVVIAVAFLAYIMATIPPHTVTNAITTYGIRNEDALYYWEELGRFWFETKNDDEVVYIEVARFPYRLAILLGSQSKADIREILSEVLLEEKPPLTLTERWAKWLQEKIPLDIDS